VNPFAADRRPSADGRRVEQILSNLLGNAIKFAPAGTTITIHFEALPDAIDVCVIDQNVPIPADQRDRIFERFYTSSGDAALAGVGLGLYICRELVRLHSGEIRAEAHPDGGNLFAFTLPLHDVEETT